MAWEPTTIRRPDQAFRTATETVRVTTDAGAGFLKALGNRGSPHYLASDWLGTKLAEWLGLPVFDIAIIEVTAEDEITFFSGQQAKVGPAFIAREENGMVWGGSTEELKLLVNPEDIGRLVLFDTWTRNCDRYPPDLAARKPNRNNVFLSAEDLEDGKFRLMAMDHTHCFNCGRDLNARLSHIEIVKDGRLFGLFPEFKPYIIPHAQTVTDALARLQTLDANWVKQLVEGLPAAWQVDAAGRAALASMICDRAKFMFETFQPLLDQAVR